MKIDCKDYNEKTPLHYASEAGSLSTVILLLELGADVNSLDDLGFTPAALAERNSHFAVLDKLNTIGGKNEVRMEIDEQMACRFLYGR
jgi:ankyrin repeat protein